MSTDAIFGQTFRCECGKTHHVEPREVFYGDDAVGQLPRICRTCRDSRRAAVLMDVRTRDAAGRDAAAALKGAGWDVSEIVVPDPGGRWPVCDEPTRQSLSKPLAGTGLVVSVGSGVVTDLAKWAAFDMGIPFVAVATAASMNGYASANVAITDRGVKTLTHARPPAAVLASPTVLAEAPYEMTAAGLGDVLAKSVSSADWYLNHVLFDDYYCPRSVGLVAEIEPLYLDHPRDLAARDGAAISALFRALLLTGAAMTMAETSAPASGGEHLISHTLDMMAARDGMDHDLHGRQVGLGTILAAELWRRALETEATALVAVPTRIDRAFWGPLADAVAEHYADKPQRLALAKARLLEPDTWDRLRREVSPMLRAPQRIRDCLREAQAACRAEDVGCDRPRLAEALLHAHEIRARFTVLDLAHLLGLLPQAAGEIVETWA